MTMACPPHTLRPCREPGTLRRLSPRPVTGQTYAMDCTGEIPVICTGGNNALVEFYT